MQARRTGGKLRAMASRAHIALRRKQADAALELSSATIGPITPMIGLGVLYLGLVSTALAFRIRVVIVTQFDIGWHWV